MKKVVKSEKAKYNNYRLHKTTLKGLTALMLGTSVMLAGCGINNTIDKHVESKVAYEKISNDDIVVINIDGINLIITKAREDAHGNYTRYEAPGGFTLGPNNICYKLTVDNNKAPEGYVLGADGKSIYPVDTEIGYYAPDGSILVGNKAVYVVTAGEIENKEDYEIYGSFGIIVEDAHKISTIKL